MSGPSPLSEGTSETKMLARSMAPPLPHLLSRHDSITSLSMLPPQNDRTLDPLSPTKKPRLSLKTSDLAPTFHGSVSRQPSISTDAAATPTTFNTFNNTFDLTYRPSPVSTLPSPGSHSQRRPVTYPLSPITRTSDQPYHLNLPFGVHPILENSPLPRDIRRPSVSASPRVSCRRTFFPAPKKVSFRAELEVEIVTKQYVMCHADLSSSEDESSPSETDEQSGASNDEEEGEGGKEPAIHVDEVSARGRRKRKSVAVSPSAASEVDRGREERSTSTSARRSKRKRRRWEWTIDSKARNPTGTETGSKEVQEDSEPAPQERMESKDVCVPQAPYGEEQAGQLDEAESS